MWNGLGWKTLEFGSQSQEDRPHPNEVRDQLAWEELGIGTTVSWFFQEVCITRVLFAWIGEQYSLGQKKHCSCYEVMCFFLKKKHWRTLEIFTFIMFCELWESLHHKAGSLSLCFVIWCSFHWIQWNLPIADLAINCVYTFIHVCMHVYVGVSTCTHSYICMYICK